MISSCSSDGRAWKGVGADCRGSRHGRLSVLRLSVAVTVTVAAVGVTVATAICIGPAPILPTVGSAEFLRADRPQEPAVTGCWCTDGWLPVRAAPGSRAARRQDGAVR